MNLDEWPKLPSPDNGEKMPMNQKNPGSPLDGLVGTGTEASHPEVKVENTLSSNHGGDHGEGPSDRQGPKRSTGTPDTKPPRIKQPRLTSPCKKISCCNCTKGSTCKRVVNCECRKAKRSCTSCLCLKNCSNVGVNPASCVEIKQKENELDLATPRTLNFEDKRGEDKNDDNNQAPKKDGAPQPSNSVDSGDEKTEVEDPTLSIGDLPGYVPNEVDLKLKEVYGDYLHQNDGTHLDGGIQDDAVWQERWKKLVGLPAQRYQAPGGAVGRRFLRILTQELLGIRSRKWNSEKFIVFILVP